MNGRKVIAIAKEHKIPSHILKKLIRTKHYSATRRAWFALDLDDEQQDVTFETIDRLIKESTRDYYGQDRTYYIYLISVLEILVKDEDRGVRDAAFFACSRDKIVRSLVKRLGLRLADRSQLNFESSKSFQNP